MIEKNKIKKVRTLNVFLIGYLIWNVSNPLSGTMFSILHYILLFICFLGAIIIYLENRPSEETSNKIKRGKE